MADDDLRPSHKALVSLHALLALVLIVLTSGGNPYAVVSGVVAFPVVLAISVVLQSALSVVLARWPVPNAIRVPLYLSPILILLLANSLLPDPPNQRSPSRSPSGRYVMKMSIRGNRWIVSIRGGGVPAYRDEDSEFMGHLNVYWTWDEQDRLWLDNSDDGRAWYWRAAPGGWQKTEWESAGTQVTPEDVHPPRHLYRHQDRLGGPEKDR